MKGIALLKNLKLQFFIQDQVLFLVESVRDFVKRQFPISASSNLVDELWDKKLYSLLKENYLKHHKLPTPSFPLEKKVFQKLLDSVYSPFYPKIRKEKGFHDLKSKVINHYSRCEKKMVGNGMWNHLAQYPESFVNPTQILYSSSIWELVPNEKWRHVVPDDQSLVVSDYKKPARLTSSWPSGFDDLYTSKHKIEYNYSILSNRILHDTTIGYIVINASSPLREEFSHIAGLDHRFKIIELDSGTLSTITNEMDQFTENLKDIDLHYEKLILAYEDIIGLNKIQVQTEQDLRTLIFILTSIKQRAKEI